MYVTFVTYLGIKKLLCKSGFFSIQINAGRKPKRQSRMNNPETLVTMGSQDTKTQHRNTKKMSNTDATKNGG
jgi:hypothetical protein